MFERLLSVGSPFLWWTSCPAFTFPSFLSVSRAACLPAISLRCLFCSSVRTYHTRPRTYHTRSNHDALSYSHVTWLYTTVGITQLPEHCKVTVLRLLLDALNLVFGLTHYTGLQRECGKQNTYTNDPWHVHCYHFECWKLARCMPRASSAVLLPRESVPGASSQSDALLGRRPDLALA